MTVVLNDGFKNYFQGGFKMFIEITIENLDDSKTKKVIKKSEISEVWEPMSYEKGCAIVVSGTILRVSESYCKMKKNLGIR